MSTAFLDGSYITLKGNALIAKLLASKGPLNFTRATVGVGEIPEGYTPETMTDLTEFKKEGLIASIDNPQNGEASVVVQVFSAGVNMGFAATQLILWAHDPGEGEIAYTFVNLAAAPEWIRPETDPVQKLATFTLNVIVSSVPLVNATINPLALARAIDLQHHSETLVMSERGVHGIKYHDGILQAWNGEKWLNTATGRPPNAGRFTIEDGVLSSPLPFGTMTENEDDNAGTLTFAPDLATMNVDTLNLD
jgi:hypothetical protein